MLVPPLIDTVGITLLDPRDIYLPSIHAKISAATANKEDIDLSSLHVILNQSKNETKQNQKFRVDTKLLCKTLYNYVPGTEYRNSLSILGVKPITSSVDIKKKYVEKRQSKSIKNTTEINNAYEKVMARKRMTGGDETAPEKPKQQIWETLQRNINELTEQMKK